MLRVWSRMAFLGVVSLVAAGCGRPPDARSRFEERLAAEGRILLRVPYGLPPESAGRSIRFDGSTLNRTALYLRHRSSAEPSVFVNEAGTVLRDGEATGATVRGGELRIDAEGQSLFLDGGMFLADLAEWELFWVGRDESPPEVEDIASPAVQFSDAFMRHELASDLCRVESGDWELCQHGGGMPKTEEEARDYSVQRAVNPFSVSGRDGALAFGPDEWDGYLGEAQVYFGVPREGEVTDCRTVPVDRDMLVAVGRTDGPQVAFGWFGDKGFALAEREGDGPWRIVSPCSGKRPPLTNWVRLGIGVRRGCLAEASLDGRVVLRRTLAKRVSGPFHLVSRGGATEWDDVRVRSYPLANAPWTPICVRSANFSQKQRKDNSDPRQFSEWSRGRDAFSIGISRDPQLGILRRITTAQPLIGDWEYQSVSYDSRAGELQAGRYRFEVLREAADEPGKATEDMVAVVDAKLDESGWLAPGPSGEPSVRVEGPLRFRRVAADEWCVAVWRDGAWRPVSGAAPGPVYLRISRVAEPGEARVSFPRPDHHEVRCRNLVTDLFESAPSDWSWIEGQCRMAARWACQNQWNFLACSGTGVPCMVSKRSFGGVQMHEYFMSMRPVTPSDAGDTSFRYDPTEDNRLEVFKSWHGWYNRRDLNFSFCCDGRNPLSGYAVVFGGEDNTATRLYRRDRVLAETTDSAFLFPPGPEHANIHWRWWKFLVHKREGRIRVLVDDKTMFDVTDPEPLAAGHIAFWTVRNGFSLAKVSSIADAVTWVPDALYVQPDTAVTPWRPVIADDLALSPGTDGLTQVRMARGCGFHALRYVPPAPIPVVPETCLRLPLRAGGDVALNAFLETSAGDFVLDLGAGTEGIKGFATPSRERGECFQLATMTAEEIAKVKLACRRDEDLVFCDVAAELAARGVEVKDLSILSLTLGRTGNASYALAGGDGKNLAAASYLVGEPVFGAR